MKLENILYKIPIKKKLNFDDPSIEIDMLAFDSRKVEKRSIFIARGGTKYDGHDFINDAISIGAVAIVCEKIPKKIDENIIYIIVENGSKTLALLAANFYDHPSKKLKLIGITGTNGKTTITHSLYQLFRSLNHKVGLISTIRIIIDEERFPSDQTTPDVLTINDYLSRMVKRGVGYCFMEVSSHGIDQCRTFHLDFKIGVFTNLTHDHLDYHKTFSAYRDTKKSFFDHLSKDAFALTNLDDKNGEIILQNTRAIRKTYAQKSLSDYSVKILEKKFNGMLLQMNHQEVWTQLVGEFNAYNLITIYAVSDLLGIEQTVILREISRLTSVEGRFEYQISEGGIIGIIDYAHTPDALNNVLSTIRDIKNPLSKIITVVGSGGDRDRNKRAKIGTVAYELSDEIILTSDNPRREDPKAILKQIRKGIASENDGKIFEILDRKEAIRMACKMAQKNDIILIAGKGHETYQEINGEKIYFNDKKTLIECFKKDKK